LQPSALFWSVALGPWYGQSQADLNQAPSATRGTVIAPIRPYSLLKVALGVATLALLAVGVIHGVHLPTSKTTPQPAGDTPQQSGHAKDPASKRDPGPPNRDGANRWHQDQPPAPRESEFAFGYSKLCKKFRAPSPLSDQEQEALRTSLKRQCGYVTEERASWQMVDRVIETMGIHSGDVIADIGCASGFHTYYLSEAAGPRGTVYAVDLDRLSLAFLAGRISTGLFTHNNVQPLVSKPDNILLPEKCLDWAFLCGVHFSERPGLEADQCVASIYKAVKPGGRLALIESTAHVEIERILEDYLKAGFQVVSTHDFLMEGGPDRPADHPPEAFVIFERPGT